MALTYEFCINRAEESAASAEQATLENVRERDLRSEAVWREMAKRIEAIQVNRDARIQEQREQAEAAENSAYPG